MYEHYNSVQKFQSKKARNYIIFGHSPHSTQQASTCLYEEYALSWHPLPRCPPYPFYIVQDILSYLPPLFMEERRTYICPPLFMEERRTYICPPF